MPYSQEERISVIQVADNDRELLFQWIKDGISFADFCELLEEYCIRTEREASKLY